MRIIINAWPYVLAGLLAAPVSSAFAVEDVSSNLVRMPVAEQRLSARDLAYVQRQREDRSIDWVTLVRIDPRVLELAKFEIDLHDRKVVVRKQALPESFGPRPDLWRGRAALPGDPPQWDPGTLRDVRLYRLEGGGIRGSIYIGDIVYLIRPLSHGIHALIRQDLSRLHSEKDDVGDRSRPVKRPQPSSLKPSAVSESMQMETVRVAVGYTAAALNGDPLETMFADVKESIDVANESFTASNIALRLELAAWADSAGYAESGNGSDIPAALAALVEGPDGTLWLPHADRDGENADLLAMAVGAGNDAICGQAQQVGASKDTALFVFKRGCLPSHTFAHEVGHLLGADHQPGAALDPPVFAYGHGFQRLPAEGVAGWSTLMATDCPPQRCPRQNFWSSPLRQHQGEAAGSVDTHDNARVLTENKARVAAFYPPPQATKGVRAGGAAPRYVRAAGPDGPDGRAMRAIAEEPRLRMPQ